MKANDGSGNIELRDEWETPEWLFKILNNQYSFDYDCCANKKNHKTTGFCIDFLNREYISYSSCWMNPPFSKASKMFNQFFKIVNKGVCIYRCDNFETKIWQEVIFPKASWIFIPNKRISYEGMEGNGSRFPSALIGYNVPPITGLDGTLLKIR